MPPTTGPTPTNPATPTNPTNGPVAEVERGEPESVVARAGLLRAPDELLLGFARALRGAGIAVTADRERTYLQAVATLGLDERDLVYWAGRATLTSCPADIERYDRVFTAWFSGRPMMASHHRQPEHRPVRQAPLDDAAAATEGGPGDDEEVIRARASSAEVLRHRDVASLTAQERAALTGLFAKLHPRPAMRRARRRVRSRTGAVDGPATLREQLRRVGEPGPIRRHRKGIRPRRIVLLIDVSGSMTAYADSLLRLAHRFVHAVPGRRRGRHGAVEVFTMGTRLTHITRALGERDADRALVAAGSVVPDWSGGTRLGDVLGAFLDLWGRRGMARGAVVVVFSDGWERDGPEVLGEQMRRLASLAHHVVWSNPHRGKAGYAPVQRGIVAALPHIDDFVAGHSFATFEEIIEVVARA